MEFAKGANDGPETAAVLPNTISDLGKIYQSAVQQRSTQSLFVRCIWSEYLRSTYHGLV